MKHKLLYDYRESSKQFLNTPFRILGLINFSDEAHDLPLIKMPLTYHA